MAENIQSEAIPPEPAPQQNHRWFDAGVWFVALSAGFLNLLNFHGYPLFSAEVGIVLVALLATAWLMAAVRRAAGPRLGFLFSALFLAVVIDLSTSIDRGWFYALWAALAVAAWFAERALLKLTLAAFGSVFLFQLVALSTGLGAPQRPDNYARNLQDERRPTAERPAIVHLVLDSYLGLDGMALGPAHYTALREDQAAFFIKHGFQVYPQAYSRHVKTVNSLPQLFSYGELPLATTNRNLQYAVPEALPYFADLDSRGYRTSAVLPNYLDLCVNQKLTHCRMFDRSALTSMLDSELDAADRAGIMAMTYLHLADLPARVLEAVTRTFNRATGAAVRRPFNATKLYQLASFRELGEFIPSLATIRSGEARVAHFLFPHDPYVLTAQCRVKPEAAWLDEHGPGEVAARERAYAEQVRCLQSRIESMIEQLDQTAAGREAIILIHGDHGSRISPIAPFIGGPELTERELLMAHSTLFAMRVPGERGASVPGVHALDELMADFRARDFASAPRPAQTPPQVLIMDAHWIPRKQRALPDFNQGPISTGARFRPGL